MEIKLEKTNDILTPTEYFDYLKSKKLETDNQILANYLNIAIREYEKAKRTGQKDLEDKLMFHIINYEKEIELLNNGINKFIYYEDIQKFVNTIDKNVVKIIELKRYPRAIPDNIVNIIEKTKQLFDEMYIVFTDYTGEVERKIEQQKKEKDPILFGVFCNRNKRTKLDRYYYIADWEDEFCDLTLDKMLIVMQEKEKKNIINEVQLIENRDKLLKELENIKKDENLEKDQNGFNFVQVYSSSNSNKENERNKKGFFAKLINRIRNN